MILRQCTNQPGFFLECHKCFFINQYKDPIPLDKKNHYSTLVTTIIWVWPLPSNSDHQDYYIFSTESLYKPLFATFTGKGPYPNYKVISASPGSVAASLHGFLCRADHRRLTRESLWRWPHGAVENPETVVETAWGGDVEAQLGGGKALFGWWFCS